MTVSTSVGRQVTIASLIGVSSKLAGLMNAAQTPDANRTNFAKLLLEQILDGLQSEGVSARAASFYTLQLEYGVWQYTMDATVLDVMGNGAYIQASEPDPERAAHESPVQQISQEHWQGLSTKSSEARPMMYYAHRVTSPCQVWLWPTPDEGGRIRFPVHRKLADTNDAGATLDLETYWHDAITWQLAHDLAAASSLSTGKLSYFQNLADKKKAHAKSYSKGHAPVQFVLDHATPWRR